VTHAPKPGPGPHTITDDGIPPNLTADEVAAQQTRPVPGMSHTEFMRQINELIAAGIADRHAVTDAFTLADDALTPNERLLNEIFAAPACAAVDMGLGCTEVATWTAELTCCHLRELCCDAHHTDIAASRRDVICNNCATPGRMGRLVDFTPYAGTTR
jgi:hypothetical protein